MAVEQLPGQLGKGVEPKGHGLTFFRRSVLGRGRVQASNIGCAGVPELNRQDGKILLSEAISPNSPQQEKYPGYRQHPAEVIFMGNVVLPRLAEVTEQSLHGKSDAEKQEYLAGLIDTHGIIESHPESIVDQMKAIRKAGLSGDHDYLGQVTELMPTLRAEKERIYAETEERSYNRNKRSAQRSLRHIKHQLGKDIEAFMPERQELPLEMVTNLAALDGMIGIFTQDAYDQQPDELKKENGKNRQLVVSRTRIRDKKLIADHVTGLLTAYIVSETLDNVELPVFEDAYMVRLSQLRPKIEEQREKLESEAPNWTRAQQYRHVLRARRHFMPHSDTLSLERETGLSPEMIADAKRERAGGYVKSSVWMGAIEGGQLGIGWAIGGGTADLFELRNLAAVATLAFVGRAATSALLYKKQQLSGEFYEKKGYAPDPATKLAGDRWNRPKLGFGLSHWPMEGVYAGATVAAMKVLGTIPGLATEIAADALAIPRQIAEIIGMRMSIQDREGSKAKWAWNSIATKIGLPQIADVKNIPVMDLRESELAPVPVFESTQVRQVNGPETEEPTFIEDRIVSAVPLVVHSSDGSAVVFEGNVNDNKVNGDSSTLRDAS